ncbi:hypothetical protein NC651_011545 [Populus alba x Populus x berolinensis]|nr:hypothetical protein NC651_011545 [Populus alba x Populus x berolinensis]
MDTAGNLKTSSIELDLDRPNIEDYLPSGSSIQEPRGKLRLRDLLDISPTLTEAAGAIVDVKKRCEAKCFLNGKKELYVNSGRELVLIMDFRHAIRLKFENE